MNEESLPIIRIGDELYYDDYLISNYAPEVIHVLHSPKHPQRVEVLKTKIWHWGKCHIVNLELTIHEKLVEQITQAIPTCKLLSSKYSGYVEMYVLQQIPKLNDPGQRGLIFRHHGLHRLSNGLWGYVCGDVVLGIPNTISFEVAPDVSKAHLAWDPDIPDFDAVQEFCLVIEKYPKVFPVVFAHTMISSFRSMITELAIPMQYSLYLEGGFNKGKTTTARRFCLLFNDSSNPPYRIADLDSSSTSAATVEIISRYRDQVVLVDDLAKSSDPSVQSKRKAIIANTLRFAANENSRSKMVSSNRSENHFCTAGLVFTGEIPLSSASDVTRLVIVKLEEKLHGGSESDRILASTVFYHLLEWILPRLDEEKERLRIQYKNFLEINHEHPRLETSLFLFRWAIELFYRFALDINAITESYKTRIVQFTNQVLEEILQYQVELVRRIEADIPAGNISFYILRGYKDGQFRIRKRKKIESDSDCVFENDSLCIRSKTLLEYIKSNTPFSDLSMRALNSFLIQEKVLSLKTENRTATKKIRGKRYLELHMQGLIRSVKQYTSSR